MLQSMYKAHARQRAFEQTMKEWGKESTTTFMLDFSLADFFGTDGVKDTLNRAFKEWKNDVKYMAELVVVLNHKIWEHYETNEPLARVYDKLWRETDNFCREHFKGEDLSYYFNFID